jgi:hypothetical protein
MLITLMAAAAVLSSDPQGAMATAPETPVTLDVAAAPAAPSVEGAAQEAAPHGLSTDQQIERWLASRAPAAEPWTEGVVGDDPEPHGEFSVTVGTAGYRDYGAAVSLPIGENARLDVSFRQVENGYYGYRYGDWGDPRLDDAGYAFPGYRPGAAAAYERQVMRPDGPPRRWTAAEQPRPAP